MFFNNSFATSLFVLAEEHLQENLKMLTVNNCIKTFELIMSKAALNNWNIFFCWVTVGQSNPGIVGRSQKFFEMIRIVSHHLLLN